MIIYTIKPLIASIENMKSKRNVIQKFRKQKQLIQEELAIKVDISYASLMKIENSTTNDLSIDIMVKRSYVL